MIATVRGEVTALGNDFVVIEVAGVGLLVHVTPDTIRNLHLGSQAQLSTSLVVREDSLTLFGFHGEDERTMFELLQSASGVGPKLAQAMLAVHSASALRLAIYSEDFKTLELVSGIGRKGAQRICLELKDRVGAPSVTHSVPHSGASGPWRTQVQSALLGLGFSPRDASEAIDAVIAELSEKELAELSISEILRIALRSRDHG